MLYTVASYFIASQIAAAIAHAPDTDHGSSWEDIAISTAFSIALSTFPLLNKPAGYAFTAAPLEDSA